MAERFSDSGSRESPEGDLRERPVGELMKELASQTSTLVRQELDLAKAEMAQKGKQAGLGVGMFGAAGIVGFLAVVALTACFVAALATGMDVWLAALIVAIVYAAIAGALAFVGRNRVKEATPPVPEQTIETVKEDVEWAKSQKPSASR
ncbi:MAG: phage holin family protein [Actinomycetota bacterium]|nr:phage holin family protein [Actinomycetota bacterium]